MLKTNYNATYNLSNCYGGLMFFNINGTQIQSGKTATDLSRATNLFYGEDTVFSGKYHKGPKDGK